MRLTILGESDGFRFLWETDEADAPSRARSALLQTARIHVDAELAAEIADSVDQAAAALDRLGQASASAPDRVDPLRRAGALIHGRLFPPALRLTLEHRPIGAALQLVLDAPAASIPWELARDGGQSLAERLAIGRRRLSEAPTRQTDPMLSPRPRALLIGNPNGDLPAATAEVEALMERFDAAGDGPRCELLCGAQASRLRMLEALAGADHAILHFAGHARPGALRLSDGWLGAEEIREALSGRPLVFLNACRSGRADAVAPAGGDLVTAFLEGGASALVATLWPVYDRLAGDLALRFYQGLLAHEGLGEALRQARLELVARAPGEAAWAAPLLHGDPTALPLPAGPTRHMGSALALRWTRTAAADAEASEGELPRRIADRVAARGGRVARLGPDRLLAVFGVPQALEDDAARALETALALRTEADLRMGLASGRIELDPRGIGLHALPIYAGPALDTAEALAEAARPGQALVDPDCARLAGRAFTLRAPEGEPAAAASRAPTPALGDAAGHGALELLGRAAAMRPMAPSRCVGRDAELAWLGQALAAARQGRGAVLGIAGEAGIGKSHLLRAFRAGCDPGTLRWIELGARVGEAPFAAVTELLNAIEIGLDEEPGADDPPGWAAEREPRLRALLSMLAGQSGGAELEMQAEDRGRLLHWLRGRLALLARSQPLVLAIDNAERLDPASLELFERLASGIERAAVVLILAHRPAWTNPFVGLPAYRSLALTPLDAPASRALAEAALDGVLGQSPALDALLERIGGNPFFIEESLRAWRETGLLARQAEAWTLTRGPGDADLPATIQRTILARCDRLPAGARQALDAAAVLAEPFRPELLARMLGGASVEPLLERLEAAGFLELRWASGEQGLRHALVGETVGAALPPERRRALHRRAALALTESDALASDPAAALERRARHALCAVLEGGQIVAGPVDLAEIDGLSGPAPLSLAPTAEAEDLRRALRALVDAGRLALGRHAARPALEHLRRALALGAALPAWDAESRAGLDEALGAALDQLGAFEAAIDAYTRAFALRSAGELDSAGRRAAADLARRIGRLLGWGAQYEAALAWMARGLDLLGEALDEAGRGSAALIHVHAGAIHYYRGDLEMAAERIQRGLGIADGTPHRAAQASAYNMLGAVHDARGERDRAIAAYRRSLALWEALDDDYQAARVADNLGISSFLLGDWPAAADLHRQALDFFEQIEDRDQAAHAALNLGNVELARGEIEAAGARFAHALALGEAVGSPRLQVMAHLNLGHAALEAGEPRRARAALARSQALQDQHAIEDFRPETLVALGNASLVEGDAASAEALAREALEAARVRALALEEALAQRLLGAALARRGEGRAAQRHLLWSERRLEGLGQAHEANRSRLALAELLHQAGEHDAAQAALRRARSGFAQLGAALDLDRADRMLAEWGTTDVA